MGNPAVVCLWYEKDAKAAAEFYAATFPNSSVGSAHKAPGDNPSTEEGAELTVDFTVCGIGQASLHLVLVAIRLLSNL